MRVRPINAVSLKLSAPVACLVSASLLAACGSSGSAHSATTRRADSSHLTVSGSAASPTAQSTGSARATIVNTCSAQQRESGCYSPEALRHAYGVTPLLAHNVNGRGVTVVLPEEAVPTKDAEKDGLLSLSHSIAAYDARYGLARARVSVDTRHAPGVDPDLVVSEEVLDVEMVHAMAPAATIRVVAMPAQPATILAKALDWSISQGAIVSFSYGVGEQCLADGADAVQDALRRARARHVSVLASAGDNGPTTRDCHGEPDGTKGVGVPGAEPLVTSVGGTSLRASSMGVYESESAWSSSEGGRHSEADAATGGGFSSRFARPSYQDGIPGIQSRRGLPDVAWSADASHGVAIVSAISDRKKCAALRRKLSHGSPTGSSASDVCGEVSSLGGTSAAAPAWAGIAALADEYAHRRLGFLNLGLYRIGHGAQYHRAFHDVTSGDNSVMLKNGTRVPGDHATEGWDPVTGWGSPNASVLVPLLAREVRLTDGRGL